MLRKFEIRNVDCANCAAKMEDGIRKLDGIDEVSVNFLTQKLLINTNAENIDELLKKVEKICKKVDSDFEIVYWG